MENPATLTPVGHNNLAVNSRGGGGAKSVDFPGKQENSKIIPLEDFIF